MTAADPRTEEQKAADRRRGGYARAASMTPEQRKALAKKASDASREAGRRRRADPNYVKPLSASKRSPRVEALRTFVLDEVNGMIYDLGKEPSVEDARRLLHRLRTLVRDGSW